MITESSELFLTSLATRYSKNIAINGFIIFLITFATFVYFSPDALSNGDAALYAQQIMNRDFSTTTIHLGYYFLGVAFTSLLPYSVDYALNIMNCFFGGLSVALIYFIAFTISKKNITGFVSSLFLATNYVFVHNSLFVEVYISQTFFLLLAIILWLRNKPFLVGLAFALAFLITPSTIFALPLFILLRPQKLPLARFIVIFFLVAVITLFPHFNDYLFGGRGLLSAASSELIIGKALLKEGREIFHGLYLYIPLMIGGIIQIVTQKKLHTFGISVLCLWLVSFVFGETTGDVPVQLPTYTLFCIVAGLGFESIFYVISGKNSTNNVVLRLLLFLISIILLVGLGVRSANTQLSLKVMLFIFTVILFTLVAIKVQKYTLKTRGRGFIVYGILALLVSLNSLLMVKQITRQCDTHVDYKKRVIEISQIADSNYIVFGGFSEGVLFEHYVFKSYLTGRWIAPEWFAGDWGEEYKEKAEKDWRNAIMSGREIWLLSDDYPAYFFDLKNADYSIETFDSIYRARPQS